MADAGNIKAKVTIEYDGAGIEKAKQDLESLAKAGGSVGEGTEKASAGLAGLEEQAGKTADSAGSLESAFAGLERPFTRAGESFVGMTEAARESADVLEKTGEAAGGLEEPMSRVNTVMAESGSSMQAVSTQAETMTKQISSANESFSQIGETMTKAQPVFQQYSEMDAIFGNTGFQTNMQTFQSALEDPMPFSTIQNHLNQTGQTWSQFTNDIGSKNTAMLQTIADTADNVAPVLDTVNTGMANMAKTANEPQIATAIQAQIQQATLVQKAMANMNAQGGVGTAQYGPEEAFGGKFGQWIESGGLGGIGNAVGGVMEGLNAIAMPLMAVQMIGMAVGAVAQGMYDAAAVAEGPAAHSFNTFTGSVDALAQTSAKAGQTFSEAFGQQLIPNIDALNTVMQDNMSSTGGIGGFLGGAVSAATILGGYALGIPLAATGLVDNPFLQYSNQSVSNMFTLPQGGNPTPQQQYIAENQGSIGMNVSQMAGKNTIGANTLLAEAGSPDYLQSQDYASASQQYLNKQQASYNASHPISQQQLASDASYQSYVANDQIAQAQAPSYGQIAGSYFSGGNIFGGLGVLASIFTGGNASMYDPGAPRSSAAQSSGLFSGDAGVGNFEVGISKGITGLVGGIGNIFSNLFGGGSEGGAGGAFGGDSGQMHYLSSFVQPGTFGGGGSGVTGASGGASNLGPQIAQQVQGIQLPHMDLGGMAASLGGSFSGISLPHLDLGGMAAGLSGSFGGIQLPHLDLGGMASSLGGSFGGIQLPHLDLGGMASSLGGSFSGIQLPHIDLSSIASSLSGAFGNISIPSLPNIGGMINSQLSGMFSGFSLPSIPDIGGQINSQISGMFSGFSLPSIPDLGGMINSTVGSMFSGFSLPSIPDIAGSINSTIGGMFSGFTIPSIPNIAGMINSALSGAFSGISIPSFSIPGFASGVTGFGGGLAVVGEAGPELLSLPTGSSVTPMGDVGSMASTIGSGGGGGSSGPQSVNLVVQIGTQQLFSAIGIPLSENIRLATGNRGF